MRCPAIGRSDQEGRFFHGDHDGCCFLPLHVFCGDHLLVACLRPPGEAFAWHPEASGRAPAPGWARSRDRMRRVIARIAHAPGAPTRASW